MVIHSLHLPFHQLRSFKAIVLGDFFLDTYTTGRVRRISPEAPVPVMEVLSQSSKPGGAGNAVLNLVALGGSVLAMGRIGTDPNGQLLLSVLQEKGVDVRALFCDPLYATPVKNRLIAESQQLLRVDCETISPIQEEMEREVIQALRTLIPQVQVVAISDYGKGFLSNTVIHEAIVCAKASNVSVIIDPKGIDFSKYRGATVLKPNLSEAYMAANQLKHTPLETVAKRLLDITEVDLLLITRSEAGISLFDRLGNRSDFPVHAKEVKDVTGAGDTVLAVMSLALANQLDMSVAVQLANIAAGLAIERLGCVQVSLSEIVKRCLEFDSHSKIFDEHHTYALHQILQDKRYSLLVLEKEQTMTPSLFRTIRTLASLAEQELVIYIHNGSADDEFVHLLSSLREVKIIILQTKSLQSLCEEIHPHEIHFVDRPNTRRIEEVLQRLYANHRLA